MATSLHLLCLTDSRRHIQWCRTGACEACDDQWQAVLGKRGQFVHWIGAVQLTHQSVELPYLI